MRENEYRMSNFEGVRLTSCASSKLFVRFYCGAKDSGFQYDQNFQHVSAGLSQSLAWQWVCADWVKTGWNMRGHPAPEGSYEMREDLFS